MAATVGDTPTDLQVSDALPGAASALAKRKLPPLSGHEAPWLLSLRSSHNSGPDWVMAVQISPKNDGPPKVVLDEEIPEKYRYHFLVTSMDNYILVKNYENQDQIYLVDPFASWTLVDCFPDRVPCSKKLDSMAKVVTHDGIAVAIAGPLRNRLVYMPLEVPGWIARNKMTSLGSFADVICCEADGLFYALSTRSNKVVALKFVSSSQIRDLDDDFDIQDMTLNLGPGFDPSDEENYGWFCLQFGHLVNSPSGLFVIRWRMLLQRGERKRREIDVYKLSADKNTWVLVDSLDGYSFFLGFNQSLIASPDDFPELRSNLIYIPYDAFWPIGLGFERASDYMDEVDYNLIYDVKTKHWEQWDRPSDMKDLYHKEMNYMIRPAVWMMPPRL